MRRQIIINIISLSAKSRKLYGDICQLSFHRKKIKLSKVLCGQVSPIEYPLPLFEGSIINYSCSDATEVTQRETPGCSQQQTATNNGVRDRRSNWLGCYTYPLKDSIWHFNMHCFVYARLRKLSKLIPLATHLVTWQMFLRPSFQYFKAEIKFCDPRQIVGDPKMGRSRQFGSHCNQTAAAAIELHIQTFYIPRVYRIILKIIISFNLKEERKSSKFIEHDESFQLGIKKYATWKTWNNTFLVFALCSLIYPYCACVQQSVHCTVKYTAVWALQWTAMQHMHSTLKCTAACVVYSEVHCSVCTLQWCAGHWEHRWIHTVR